MDHLQEGLALVTQAVQFDKDGNYEKACEYYERALVNLEQSLIVERDPQRKTLISQKVGEYRLRNETLRQQLSKRDLTNRMSNIGVGTLPSQQYEKVNVPQQQTSPMLTSQPSFVMPLKPPSLMTKSEAYQAAAELCQKGAAEDEAHQYEKALELYISALDYFARVLQEETNPELRQKANERMRMYMDRAEQLKIALSGMQPQTLVCEFCKKPVDPSATYKVVGESPYHPACFEQTIGLEKEATKTFVMTRDHLFMKVKIPKRVFTPGEEIQITVHVENGARKIVKKVSAYILKTDTHVELVSSSKYGVERKAKRKENKFGRRDYYGVNNQFPMDYGAVTLTNIPFTVPNGLHLSELTGPFSREYEFVVKCVLTKPNAPLKVVYPITIK